MALDRYESVLVETPNSFRKSILREIREGLVSVVVLVLNGRLMLFSLVFVEQTTLAIPNYSKKRNSSNGNNKKKSRSMLRRTNLPVIDEREVDNDQPGEYF